MKINLQKLLLLSGLLSFISCQQSKDQALAPTGSPDSMGVPSTQAVVYRPLGKTAGGYQSIAAAKFPDLCTKGAIVPTTGALFPFNENQTLVVRGPLILSELSVFQKKAGSDLWTHSSDLTSLVWQENNYGSIKSLGTYPAAGKVLENGREIFATLAATGELLLVFKAQMPTATTAVYSAVSQDDVPAVWLLNSKIFQAPSGQYFCNCRGLGNPGGCGELDIAEIVPEKKSEVSTTIYSYEGARGAVLSKARPRTSPQIYAALLRTTEGVGEVQVLELDGFDFTISSIADLFLSKEWLSSATRINKGSESLNPP
jgi:hypothetical protein